MVFSTLSVPAWIGIVAGFLALTVAIILSVLYINRKNGNTSSGRVEDFQGLMPKVKCGAEVESKVAIDSVLKASRIRRYYSTTPLNNSVFMGCVGQKDVIIKYINGCTTEQQYKQPGGEYANYQFLYQIGAGGVLPPSCKVVTVETLPGQIQSRNNQYALAISYMKDAKPLRDKFMSSPPNVEYKTSDGTCVKTISSDCSLTLDLASLQSALIHTSILGVGDGHLGNVLYDERTNKFTIIDLEDAMPYGNFGHEHKLLLPGGKSERVPDIAYMRNLLYMFHAAYMKFSDETLEAMPTPGEIWKATKRYAAQFTVRDQQSRGRALEKRVSRFLGYYQAWLCQKRPFSAAEVFLEWLDKSKFGGYLNQYVKTPIVKSIVMGRLDSYALREAKSCIDKGWSQLAPIIFPSWLKTSRGDATYWDVIGCRVTAKNALLNEALPTLYSDREHDKNPCWTSNNPLYTQDRPSTPLTAESLKKIMEEAERGAGTMNCGGKKLAKQENSEPVEFAAA